MIDRPPFLRFDLGDEQLRWWVKVVEFLQQNWATIVRCDGGMVILFVNDLGGVFDWIDFADEQAARSALIRNGFEDFEKDASLREFLKPPERPLGFRRHPIGPIYSSGRHWKS